MITPVVEKRSNDRRQQHIPVEFDRRSGVDRRELAKEAAHEKHQSENPLLYAFESVPTFRRALGVTNNYEKGDTTTAIGLASLALINVEEDFRDVKSSANQIKSYFTGRDFSGKEFKSTYDYKDYQHNFSFFRGTLIEKWLHKQSAQGKKWADWLISNDKTLADTSVGEKVLDFMNVENKELLKTPIKHANGKAELAFAFKGSGLATLTARAMKRTTKLGLITLGLLEVPRIAKSSCKGDDLVDKTESVAKQVEKSAVNVASIAAGIGYAGAIGSKHFGPAGSLIGMGLGAVLGSKLSDKIQDLM